MEASLKVFRSLTLLFAAAITPAIAGYTVPEGHWCRALCGSQTGIVGLHLSAIFLLLFLASFPIAKLLRGGSWMLSGWRLTVPIIAIPAGLVLHRVLYSYYDSCYWFIAVGGGSLARLTPQLPVFRSWGGSWFKISEYFGHSPLEDFYYLLAWALAISMVFVFWARASRK